MRVGEGHACLAIECAQVRGWGEMTLDSLSTVGYRTSWAKEQRLGRTIEVWLRSGSL